MKPSILHWRSGQATAVECLLITIIIIANMFMWLVELQAQIYIRTPDHELRSLDGRPPSWRPVAPIIEPSENHLVLLYPHPKTADEPILRLDLIIDKYPGDYLITGLIPNVIYKMDGAEYLTDSKGNLEIRLAKGPVKFEVVL